MTYVAFSWLSVAHQSWGARLGGSDTQRGRVVAWREGFGLAGVVVAVLIFVLGRERSIGFTEMTGDDYALRLKRSVIEGQEISEERLAEIAAIMSAATASEHFDQASTTLLYFSP